MPIEDAELECVVHCPVCRTDKFEVRRVKLAGDGHYAHVTVPPNIPLTAQKYCVCGAVLERKRGP